MAHHLLARTWHFLLSVGTKQKNDFACEQTNWLLHITMMTIGLFEAKTKLSELCEQVAKRRQAVVITRRGRPLVRIEPVGPGKGMRSSVWDSRDAWEKKHGSLREDLEAPARARQTWRNPLKD
jgi:prevent-host-death family protein